MCGRFVAAADLDAVAAYFDTPLPGYEAPRSYNVAPTADIVAVVGDGEKRRLETFRWGLVPPWAADPGKGPPLFNARAETAASKPSFRSAFKQRRCLVPADGFYEWPKAPKGTTADERPLPQYITRADGGMLAMAGLWERWRPSPVGDASADAGSDAGSSVPAGPRQALHSATVLTTTANDFMTPIHDRMPVLLERSAWDAWLDPGNDSIDMLSAMCAPAADGVLRSQQVGRAVGSARNDDASLIEPVEPVPPAPSTTLF